MIDNSPAETSLEDLRRLALEHYERLATIAHEWNNQIPQAIEAWHFHRLAPSATQPVAEQAQREDQRGPK